jgi:DNA (cytosine-5)-methyltransferase 1
MKILDLFCCCGGASTGLSENGQNEVVGVDFTNCHNYPFKFVHSDVFKLDKKFFDQFDFIWASPPCQQFSIGSKRWLNSGYDMPPNLIPETRDLLMKTGKPFVMENVPNAPLRRDLILCGEIFGLRVIRHRHFEIEGFKCIQPKHPKHKPRIDPKHSYYSQIAGHGGDSYSYKIEDWKKDIGIDWVNDKEHLVEMIPPAYSQYIISQLKNVGK